MNFNKEYFYKVDFSGISNTCTCSFCDEMIDTEDDNVFVDFEGQFEYCDEEGKETLIEILETEDFGEIEDYIGDDLGIWRAYFACEHCYKHMDSKNEQRYEDFLDLVFKDYPKQSRMYRDYMLEWFPNTGSGSCRVLNKILNSIFYYDYYTVDITGIGVFDPDNREFVKQTLIKFSGVDIDLMREVNSKKNKMLGW